LREAYAASRHRGLAIQQILIAGDAVVGAQMISLRLGEPLVFASPAGVAQLVRAVES
jgi:hypothetical protein